MRRSSFISALICALIATSAISVPSALAERSAAPPTPAGWTMVEGRDVSRSPAQALFSPANGRYTSAELAYAGDSYAMLRARATAIGAGCGSAGVITGCGVFDRL